MTANAERFPAIARSLPDIIASLDGYDADLANGTFEITAGIAAPRGATHPEVWDADDNAERAVEDIDGS